MDHFYCHWQYQGKGIGKAFMQTIIEAGQNQDIERLYAQVSMTARPFFEYFGFTLVSEQQVKIVEQKLTNFVMEKWI
ncbi:GNAT family N-acetyltransferase [Catenovulum adriaticum]|uniref:GNAT family N-acetyltransferase n=1 Tax=Catenovulum adriaticum TaxID=2984846 RepID=A0ABY7AVG3_9ALTE|nr:GNAT family N-acetyltransferase [Catenovulum sp. TS8]WAJ72490.1 GNAT family N-acetyltransferase [Catenovulum sp. TS8]